jgi:DDE superfamily endonuclease
MLDLPKPIIQVLRSFEPVFSERVWEWVKVLLVGAILAPGKRTVSAALRVMGLSEEAQYQNYHRVLNRAVWSSRCLSERLLRLVVDAFVPKAATLVLGLDDHIERRRGEQIAAKGIYRDAVRSSKSFFVKTSGLRWVSMMVLTKIPWIGRVWALPFLTVLAPSARYHQERGVQHKKLTDWARQMMRQVRRWLPNRALVVVVDSSYAVLDLLATCVNLRQPITVVTRLRLDAALYDPAPLRKPGPKGAPRKKGARQPTLAQRSSDPTTQWTSVTLGWYANRQRTVELATGTAIWYHTGMPTVPLRWVLIRDPLGKFTTQALLCTDLSATPAQIVEWFVLRWQLEVTFEEARAHLGIETQRQWSPLAILRTTPALLALFSLVTLFAHHLLQGQALPVRQAAWYPKAQPTFSDTLAFVRQQLWPISISYLSPATPDMLIIPKLLFRRLTDTLAFAA